MILLGVTLVATGVLLAAVAYLRRRVEKQKARVHDLRMDLGIKRILDEEEAKK